MAMEERERLWSIEDAPVDDESLTADDEQALEGVWEVPEVVIKYAYGIPQ